MEQGGLFEKGEPFFQVGSEQKGARLPGFCLLSFVSLYSINKQTRKRYTHNRLLAKLQVAEVSARSRSPKLEKYNTLVGRENFYHVEQTDTRAHFSRDRERSNSVRLVAQRLFLSATAADVTLAAKVSVSHSLLSQSRNALFFLSLERRKKTPWFYLAPEN